MYIPGGFSLPCEPRPQTPNFETLPLKTLNPLDALKGVDDDSLQPASHVEQNGVFSPHAEITTASRVPCAAITLDNEARVNISATSIMADRLAVPLMAVAVTLMAVDLQRFLVKSSTHAARSSDQSCPSSPSATRNLGGLPSYHSKGLKL